MNHDYAINSNFNIGKEGTDNILKVNGIDVTQLLKGYTGSDSINIDADNEISVADGGITISKLAQNVLNFLIPTGVIVPYVGNEAPDGWMMCDGQIVSKDKYPNLYAVLATSAAFRDDNNNVCVPDLRSIFIKGKSANAQMGEKEGSSLPNIRGDGIFFSDEISSTKTLWGAFKPLAWADKHATDVQGASYENGDGGNSPDVGFQLDASAYSSVYKDGVTEVTPPNMSLNYIIKL